MERPNWLLDIPADEYHQATKENKYMTSHRLSVLRRDPLEYRQRCDGIIVDKDTASFVVGRATHTMVLEGPARFSEEYTVSDGPINPRTGKPFGRATKERSLWEAEQTLPVIGTEECKTMDLMREAVHSHPIASTLLANGIAEGTVRTEWNGVPIQTRMDWFNPETGSLVDLKTCADVDKFRFDVRDFDYVYQLAFYAKALQLVGYDKPINCHLVAAEKKEPYRVAVVRISAMTLIEANENHMGNETWRNDNEAMIAEFKEYTASGKWPTRYEKEIII